ncbi:MAG: fructosamine kinase family protein [Gammaproteobacteria bacterium]|nr:fructosamine kinase family protein [Gammaproteobacteria bacterium]
MNTSAILNFASKLLGVLATRVSLIPVGGGDINQSYVASTQAGDKVFIKVNRDVAPLQSEFDALRRLQDLGVKFYPQVKAFERGQDGALLALNFVELRSVTARYASSVADALRLQHAISCDRFGWFENGHIGYSVQVNEWRDDWIDFFTDMRLLPQLIAARDNGMSVQLVRKVERVIKSLGHIIDTSLIRPALVHGDLWVGNLAIDNLLDQPLLFDPAPYFGDAEVDIAMTKLFGSLPEQFYESYKSQARADSVGERHAVYNLYHALNHFNIFGAGYERMVENFCTKLRA